MLSLVEQLMLLAIHEEKGTISSGSSYIGYGLVGALLIDLMLMDRILIKDKKVYITDASVTGDIFLDEVLGYITQSKKPRTVQYWVSKLPGHMRNLWRRVADRMENKGIVKLNIVRAFGLFTTTRYPVINTSVRGDLIENLRTAVLSDSQIENHMVALISLINACNFLRIFFEQDEKKPAIRRAKLLMKEHPVGKAVEDTITAIQASVVLNYSPGL